jgi:hypothetical protein
MISAVRAAPKSGFHGVRLGCGDIHPLKRCFILTISLSLYSRKNCGKVRFIAHNPRQRHSFKHTIFLLRKRCARPEGSHKV